MNLTTTQAEILTWLAEKTTSYLEVGVQEGYSLSLVLDNAPGLRRIALCDTWGHESGGSGRGSHAHIEELLADRELQVTYLDGDSTVLLPNLDERQPFDLVHIDGGHGYEVAFSDLVHGWRLCRTWMVVHDVSFPEVWRALFDFLQSVQVLSFDVYVGGHGTAVLRK